MVKEEMLIPEVGEMFIKMPMWSIYLLGILKFFRMKK